MLQVELFGLRFAIAVAVPPEPFASRACELGANMRRFVSGGLSSWVRFRVHRDFLDVGLLLHARRAADGQRRASFARLPREAHRHVRPCLLQLCFYIAWQLVSEGGAHVDLTRFSPKQKEVWGNACNVAWPCA